MVCPASFSNDEIEISCFSKIGNTLRCIVTLWVPCCLALCWTQFYKKEDCNRLVNELTIER